MILKIKKRIDDNLRELLNKLNKKDKYKYHDRYDLDYHGIRDTENLFDNVDNNKDYYKPNWLKVVLMKAINITKADVIKIKNYQ